MLDGVRLGEKSSAACAVAAWGDHLYIAWTGTDLRLNVAWSPDARVITGKQRLAERSYKMVSRSSGSDAGTTTESVPLAPALAASGERLYLAWTGGNSALNVLAAQQPGRTAPLTLKERSPNSPSLAAAENGTLLLAWTGNDRHVNLLGLAGEVSGTPGAKTRFEAAKSGHSPAVCGHRGSLILAWTGTDRRINVLDVTHSPYGAPVRLDEATSGSAPVLCSFQGSLILAWAGGDRRLNLARLQ